MYVLLLLLSFENNSFSNLSIVDILKDLYLSLCSLGSVRLLFPATQYEPFNEGPHKMLPYIQIEY